MRIAVVLGLALGLAACQTDLGENLGSIFKRDAPEPAANATTAEAPAAPDLWGPERGGTASDGQMTAVSLSAVKQFECTAAVFREVNTLANAGKLSVDLGSDDHRTRRSCVVAGLCDTIDGIPDYFRVTRVLNSPREKTFLNTCPGVESWGPGMIASEPALFAVARRIRDEHQAAFRSGAR
ncbi:MAG: hypothetical protein AB7N54_06370 [Alphaproteobacteria bacterium]